MNIFSLFKKEKTVLGFWANIKKPMVVLAPMADVTDVSFRQMFAKYGKPDVTWTEFVAADGLIRSPKDNLDENGLSSNDKLWKDLLYFENERPIVAQLFSGNPQYMEQASYEVTLKGFDGIDINMGCPDKTIQRQKAGAFLIKDPKRATAIINAVKKGITRATKEMNKEPIPFSVKTRLGFNQDTMEEWVTHILKSKPAVLTIHARTRKEMSKVPANWGRIKDAVILRNKLKSETLIFGNGDVLDLDDAHKKVKETGCDGVMVGRGVFGNPWFFANLAQMKSGCQIEHSPKAPLEGSSNDKFTEQEKHMSEAQMKSGCQIEHSPKAPLEGSSNDKFIEQDKIMNILDEITPKQKLDALVEHSYLFEKHLSRKNFGIMKKHFKAYVNGFDGAKELRNELMEVKNAMQVEGIVKMFLRL